MYYSIQHIIIYLPSELNNRINKMTRTRNNVEKLNLLIKEGKIMEAFEKYYGEDVIIQVNGNPQVNGKVENRKREMIFLQEINKLNSAEINSVTFGGEGDNVSMTEWAITIENDIGEQKIIYRVNVQHWKDDKIINEKLYFCGDQKF
jgi:hypothetical protein